MTVKIVFTQEANEECNEVIYRKSNFIDSSGSNIRTISKEALQTFFALTKDPNENSRSLSNEEKDFFIKLDPKEITFDKLVEWFGNTTDITDGRSTNRIKSKFVVTDKLSITPSEYKLVKTKVDTTIGRLIFNKVFIEGLGFSNIFTFKNEVMFAKVYKKFDYEVTNALKNDIINTHDMIKYINTRDWLGLQLHAVITNSFTPGVLKVPPKVEALKKKLIEENKEAIANGDIRIVEEIEQKLIKATLEELKGDPGLDLYLSGARGSVDNHLKNLFLIRGAVQNTVTGRYDIITNSLMDGLDKKDIPTHSNMIISGSYPKAVKGVLAA